MIAETIHLRAIARAPRVTHARHFIGSRVEPHTYPRPSTYRAPSRRDDCPTPAGGGNIQGMNHQPFPIVMEDVTDPEELARARAQRERFDRNFAWFEAHAAEIYERHRGKCIYVAGNELFVADTPEEVSARATAAHPGDDGGFIHYIPREKRARIYAH